MLIKFHGRKILPHFHIEYSGNLGGRVNMNTFCKAIHEAIFSTGLFELGAIRVRAFCAEHFAMTDMNPANAFIDMSFRVGQGRSQDQLKAAGETIFKSASDHLAALFATPHFALSLEVREIDASLSWKKNSMHARLRQGS
jgi:5-carboxymethyl-2-hydroxymuconate isomerase